MRSLGQTPAFAALDDFFGHQPLSPSGNNMDITVQYWHWLVFGMILIMAEIFVPSFTIFWFGLGGLVVAGLLLLFSGISFTWQLFIWAIASCVFTFLWFKFIRPMMTDRTRAGICPRGRHGRNRTGDSET
jgi:membrane protein implicated in regulation of membrane protease activity